MRRQTKAHCEAHVDTHMPIAKQTSAFKRHPQSTHGHTHMPIAKTQGRIQNTPRPGVCHRNTITHLEAAEKSRGYETYGERHGRPEAVRSEVGHHRQREDDRHSPDARQHTLGVKLRVFEVLLDHAKAGKTDKFTKFREAREGRGRGEGGRLMVAIYSRCHRSTHQFTANKTKYSTTNKSNQSRRG